MGVISMTIAGTAGVNPVISGGAVISGCFFGDRCCFLVSPNVEVTGSEVLDTGFAYSDHNPIIMTVKLRDAA